MSNLVSAAPLASARPTVSAGRALRAHADVWWLAVALGVSAWCALRPLTVEWSINPQYAYGWTVPFLTLYLLARQWSSRPLSRAPAAGTSARRWTLLAAAGLLFLQLPMRWLQEANPDWRPLNWLVVGDLVALLLLAFFLLGGRPWVRHFAFPIVFLLVAVPWPERFETACVQGLMRGVTTVVIELLDWLGVPAVQQGNLIQVSSGLIGVEEACSGIRSLQSTFMVALFLGEYYTLSFARRATLVLAGGALAMATNLGRALTLVLISVRQGKEAFGRWHDTAGLAVFLACLGGLWLIALWLDRRQPAPESTSNTTRPTTIPALGLPIALLIGCALWPLGVEAAVSLWYRSRETGAGLDAPLTWSPRWPTGANAASGGITDFRENEIPDASRAMLRYSEGRAASWNSSAATESAVRWSMFFARWAPGQSAAPAAKMHTPRVCLSASGRELRRDLGVAWLAADSRGLQLPFHAYVFDAGGGQELHVFYCLWEDRRREATDDRLAADDLTARGRFLAAVHGRRNLGQRVLEISLFGPADDASAQAVLAQHLPELIQRAD
ncbi:MAG: exosortase/archaeosortase family protein [Verrucomicrobia bacterium]|nr:exosortase/archaeosortase family protein [Verrucomicrobiota bacterium]